MIMMTSSNDKILKGDLKYLLTNLCGKDIRIITPTQEKSGNFAFAEIKNSDEFSLPSPATRMSAKGLPFPSTEVIFTYKLEKGKVDLEPANDGFPETIIFGGRPCDAAAQEVFDKVMTWDYNDEPYLSKREKITFVTVACSSCDDACFCTSVGGAPDSERGSDILLCELNDGKFSAKAITEKGEKLLCENKDLFGEGSGEKKVAEVKSIFDHSKVKTWLDSNFENDFWQEVCRACLGCGVCTYLCPTCHCFDIVDENSYSKGTRRRNWDTCQSGLFTMHGSGHNPRPSKSSRWRQRIMHKFKYYVEKFNDISCVGCGRCVRHCPVKINIIEQLSGISNK